MEAWEREHINANLRLLVEYTTCNSYVLADLKSKDIFADGDLEQIVSISSTNY